MDGVRYTKPVRAVDDIKLLTVDEQKKFIEVAKHSHNYHQYVLILETGLRTGQQSKLVMADLVFINCGMQPKILQKLLGHESIKTTMDRYVHVTDDSLNKAVQQFERLFA